MAANPIIMLWTTPRSRSTAFERMMIERHDHLVIDEPFSARYYFSSERRSDRYEPTDPDPTGAAVLTELRAAAAERPVFVKDMAYHATGLVSDEFISNFTNTFLVRRPAAAISSLAAKWPDFTSEEAGYEALESTYRIAREVQGSPPAVIESDELASDPPGIIAAWCEGVGIPFMAEALTWEAGMVPEWIRWQEWYEGVARSTGFRPPSDAANDPRGRPEHSDSQSDVPEALGDAQRVYEELTHIRLSARS